MVLKSFIIEKNRLRPIEVEVVLTPGLPTITILGLPDTLIKESILRIQTALVSQGFEMPLTERVVVNLRPLEMRKHSDGLDLVIALGILLETKQIPLKAEIFKSSAVIGQLSLAGQVFVNEAWADVLDEASDSLLMGRCAFGLHRSSVQISELRELRQDLVEVPGETKLTQFSPQKDTIMQVNSTLAPLALAMAFGEHSLFLAGTPGAGKTTLAKAIWQLLLPVSLRDEKTLRHIYRMRGLEIKSRPLVSPHHTSSEMAILGGGAQVLPGAVSLAHKGVLLLDEYLEFSVKVQESLREPLEEKKIHLFKGPNSHTYPADILLIATSNLCPCGNWLPPRLRHEKSKKCKCGSRRLESYQNKMRGPVLDRFTALHYVSQNPLEGKLIDISSLKDQMQRARTFVLEKRPWQKVTNQNLPLDQFVDVNIQQAKDITVDGGRSIRRVLALLRLARSLADLEQSITIEPTHLFAASEWASTPFHDWI